MWKLMKYDTHKIIKNCNYCVHRFYKVDECSAFECLSKVEKRAVLSFVEFILMQLKKRRY
jgi:hypothetical protein